MSLFDSKSIFPCGFSMLTNEINTGEIPEIYQNFARVINARHWGKRVAVLKQDMKGNRFLRKIFMPATR